MRLPTSAALLLVLPASPVAASSFENEAGEYTLTALPDPVREARRMDRMQLSDQQPAGRHVRKGESISIVVAGLPAGAKLAATVGFLSMWNVAQTEQSQPLVGGLNRLRANQSVLALCELTGHDLREFFERWGLRASAEADARLDASEYATPDEDLSAIFE